MGINVPVLPIAVNTLPGEMIAQLQAIAVKPDLSDFAERLREIHLDQVVLPPPPRPLGTSAVADLPETRTELLIKYANRLLEGGAYGRVRQRGLFSSFSLPSEALSDPIWDRFDGSQRRSPYQRELVRGERLALEQHARRHGCSLILDPYVDFAPVGADVHRTQ